MVNLLLSLVVQKEFNSDIVQSIVDRVKPDRLCMFVAQESELPVFEQFGECVLRRDLVHAAYSEEQLDLEHSYPLEDDVIRYMNRYALDIIFQQRRFEGYPGFPIEDTVDVHYTVYRHNLFFLYNLLRRKQITHVYLAAIPHEGYDYMLYYLCRYLNIPVQLTHSCFIPPRRFPLKDFEQDSPELKSEYAKLLEEYRDADIADIPLEGKTRNQFERWSSQEPEQMKPAQMRKDPFTWRLRQRFGETNIIRVWRGVLGEDYVKYGVSPKFITAAVRKIPLLCKAIPMAWKRYLFEKPVKRESIRLRNYYQTLTTMPVADEKYIYFPLQYQPEATSNPMGGGMYADQVIPLQILSKSLPEDVKIYVKIHPEQLSLLRTEGYYREIASIPKVRMIPVAYSTYELIKNALAVSCLTGTALWECHFFGAPAIAFGYSVKNMAPFTFPVRTVEDCMRAVEEIMKKPRREISREVKIYAKALHNISFDIADLAEVLPDLIEKFVNETQTG